MTSPPPEMSGWLGRDYVGHTVSFTKCFFGCGSFQSREELRGCSQLHLGLNPGSESNPGCVSLPSAIPFLSLSVLGYRAVPVTVLM